MMLFYLPRLSDILCEAILKRTINQQDALMKLTNRQHQVFEGLKPCTDIYIYMYVCMYVCMYVYTYIAQVKSKSVRTHILYGKVRPCTPIWLRIKA